jgi:hypothetical protein
VNDVNSAGDALPNTAIIAVPLSFLPWLMIRLELEFPFPLLIALTCVVSMLFVGVLAFFLFRQRAVSAAHRFALYICLAFFGGVGILLLLD